MKTKPSRTSPAERRAQVVLLRDRLAEWQGETSPEEIAAFTAMFDGYSPRNACLVAMQCPTATQVRGFKEWRQHGRTVRKSERGIAILAPVTGRVVAEDGAEERGLVAVRITYVFDVSQTDELAELEEES